MIIVNGPAYIRPVGDDDGEWKLLGSVTGRYSLLEPSEQDPYTEIMKEMRKPLAPGSVTLRLSSSQLERRAHLRLVFGLESGSLIHNGKKRRKR